MRTHRARGATDPRHAVLPQGRQPLRCRAAARPHDGGRAIDGAGLRARSERAPGLRGGTLGQPQPAAARAAMHRHGGLGLRHPRPRLPLVVRGLPAGRGAGPRSGIRGRRVGAGRGSGHRCRRPRSSDGRAAGRDRQWRTVPIGVPHPPRRRQRVLGAGRRSRRRRHPGHADPRDRHRPGRHGTQTGPGRDRAPPAAPAGPGRCPHARADRGAARARGQRGLPAHGDRRAAEPGGLLLAGRALHVRQRTLCTALRSDAGADHRASQHRADERGASAREPPVRATRAGRRNGDHRVRSAGRRRQPKQRDRPFHSGPPRRPAAGLSVRGQRHQRAEEGRARAAAPEPPARRGAARARGQRNLPADADRGAAGCRDLLDDRSGLPLRQPPVPALARPSTRPGAGPQTAGTAAARARRDGQGAVRPRRRRRNHRHELPHDRPAHRSGPPFAGASDSRHAHRRAAGLPVRRP